MKKRTKLSLVLSSLAAIAIAGATMAGGTYALFTSESKVNIAVNSGKVDVKASIGDLSVYSPTEISTGESNEITNDTNSANADTKTFVNGGTASLDADGALTLSKVTPGDKVSFTFKLKNESNVKAQYRIVISCDEDDGLFNGLEVKLGDTTGLTFAQKVPGITTITKYASIEENSDDLSVPMTIELPTTAGNEYQDKKCKIVFKVEAIQGNAKVSNAEEGVLELYNKTDLVSYGKLEGNWNSVTYSAGSPLYGYKTIKLMNDIDLNNEEWTPLSNLRMTFDGNNKTIKNLKIDGNNSKGNNLGLFATIQGPYANQNIAAVKDLTIENVDITNGTSQIGALTGYSNGLIENVSVKGSIKMIGQEYIGAIVGKTYENELKNCSVDGGSKDTSYIKAQSGDQKNVGGIAGWTNDGSDGTIISGCSVKNISLYGKKTIGGITSTTQNNGSISNCTVENVDIKVSVASNDHVGEILGRYVLNGSVQTTIPEEKVTNCTATSVNITYNN